MRGRWLSKAVGQHTVWVVPGEGLAAGDGRKERTSWRGGGGEGRAPLPGLHGLPRAFRVYSEESQTGGPRVQLLTRSGSCGGHALGPTRSSPAQKGRLCPCPALSVEATPVSGKRGQRCRSAHSRTFPTSAVWKIADQRSNFCRGRKSGSHPPLSAAASQRLPARRAAPKPQDSPAFPPRGCIIHFFSSY